jgi:hypothetical protein
LWRQGAIGRMTMGMKINYHCARIIQTLVVRR